MHNSGGLAFQLYLSDKKCIFKYLYKKFCSRNKICNRSATEGVKYAYVCARTLVPVFSNNNVKL